MTSLPASRAAAWTLAAGAAAAAERLTASEPAGLRLLAITSALLYGLKAVVAVEARATDGTRLGAGRWLAFSALWPGMRPALFARPQPAPLPGGWRLAGRGLVRLVAGSLLVCAAAAVGAHGHRLPASVLALPGLSLILHFGIFNLVAGTWRLGGINAKPLFRAPLRATSLTEFWGRRWNLAFSEMTSLAVYRPLRGVWGTGGATVASFALSGLLHEAAISLPVRAGYGLPLAYFLLQATLVSFERYRSRPLGRLWTMLALAVPLPLLFHRPFLAGIIWPLLGIG